MKMSAEQGNKSLKFDKRLLEWNMNNGQLSKEELQKHLEQLPDLSNRVDLLRMAEEKHPQPKETH
jgi:hypothetical protein